MPNLKKLKNKACTVNILFHFHRNNPRTTAYIYNRLISEIGYEKWPKIHPSIRSEWDSARLSFDKMYGLLKAWSESENDLFAEYAGKPETEKEPSESDIIKSETDLLKNKIEKLKAEKELHRLESNQVLYNSETIKEEIKNALNEFCEKANKITLLYKKEVEKE